MLKSQNHLILFIYILLNLLTISSQRQNLKMFLENDELNLTNNTNIKNETSSYTEDPGSYLLAWFVIFFFIGSYMICSMKNYESVRNRTDEVWKFMFFANNGILVASTVNIFNIQHILVDSSPFALSTIIFIIGMIYYIHKYITTCNKEKAEYYFGCDKLSELSKIPCFIWSLIGLTDPCCRSNSYTVTVYSDGTTESTYCCHTMWNCFIYIIKRLATIFSIVAFYIFLLFFIFYWLIAKIIYQIIFSCQEKDNNQENNENNNNINNNMNQNNEPVIYPNQINGNQGPVPIYPVYPNNLEQINNGTIIHDEMQRNSWQVGIFPRHINSSDNLALNINRCQQQNIDIHLNIVSTNDNNINNINNPIPNESNNLNNRNIINNNIRNIRMNIPDSNINTSDRFNINSHRENRRINLNDGNNINELPENDEDENKEDNSVSYPPNPEDENNEGFNKPSPFSDVDNNEEDKKIENENITQKDDEIKFNDINIEENMNDNNDNNENENSDRNDEPAPGVFNDIV